MCKHIVTLCLNPSIDTTLWIPEFALGEEMVVQTERKDPSGKAVNVSRVLGHYEVENTAVLLAGRDNLALLRRLLEDENFNYRIIEVDGSTRENISIANNQSNLARFIRKSFVVDYDTIGRIKDTLTEVVKPDTLVVISGRLPDGISNKLLGEICDHLRNLGAAISFDSVSVTATDIITQKPWVIKPNLSELEKMVGQELTTPAEIIAACKPFVEAGVHHCLVSMGGDGALYTGVQGNWLATVPEVDVKSTVGAGDSLLAGFIIGVRSGHSISKCLAAAVAFGTAACMLEGTQPPHKLTFANILTQVSIQPLP